MSKDPAFYEKARKRYDYSKSAWSKIREDYAYDNKMVNDDQWDPEVRAARQNKENPRPVLSFPREHNLVQYISNQVRQNRPSIHVNPESDATADDAHFREDRIRHIQYASHADVAYDHAVECSSTGGIGWIEITADYIDDEPSLDESAFDQQPGLKRVLDPTTIYPDPDFLESDASDMGWTHHRQRHTWDDFKRQYPKAELTSWPSDGESTVGKEWGDEQHVWLSKYWHVEKTARELIAIQNDKGEKRVGYEDELKVPNGFEVFNRRPVLERSVHCDVMNAVETLQRIDWSGKWIPLVPILGREVVVDGKRKLLSVVRFVHDVSRLINMSKTGIAEAIGTNLRAQFIGYKGVFKDQAWRNNPASRLYLEVEPTDIKGQPAPLPQAIQREAPIQALAEFSAMLADDMKSGANIFDSSTGAAKAEYSGVSVQKRTNQAELVNFHFGDNLTRSQWHIGRILLDLDTKLTDTPRQVMTRGENGETKKHFVTRLGEDGNLDTVKGRENEPHIRMDVGKFGITVTSAPSYANRFQQTFEMLGQMLQADPTFMAKFGDLFFNSWQDLPDNKSFADRAKFGLLPAIQQSLSGQAAIDPAQMQAMQAQVAVLKQEIQKLLMEKQAKVIEQKGRLEIEVFKGGVALTVADLNARHEAAVEQMNAELDSIKHMLSMFQESELAATPDPNAPPPGEEAAPQGGQE